MTDVTTRQGVQKLFAASMRNVMDEALASFTPEQIVKQIMHDMQKARVQITTSLLGIDNRWSRWEINNGSPLADFISSQCQDELRTAAQAMVKEALVEVLIPASQAAQGRVRAMFQEQLCYKLNDEITAQVEQLAADIARQTIAEYTAEVRAAVIDTVEVDA